MPTGVLRSLLLLGSALCALPALAEAPAAGSAAGSEAEGAAPAEPEGRGLLGTVRHESVEFGRDTVGDAIDLLFSPLDWRAKEWLAFGAVGLGTGLLFLADEPLDRAIGEGTTFGSDGNHAIRQLGTAPGLVAVTGGFALTGLVFDRPKERETARLLLESLAIAQLFQASLKVSLGRERPREGEGHTAFDLFGSGRSMPSGETTSAFAMATVVSAQYPRWPVRVVAYSGAALVGLARMDRRAHWSSDVFLSAAIGTFVTRGVLHRHRQRQRDSEDGGSGLWIVPTPRGLALASRF